MDSEFCLQTTVRAPLPIAKQDTTTWTYFLKACMVPFFSAGGSASGSGSLCCEPVFTNVDTSTALELTRWTETRGIRHPSSAFEDDACPGEILGAVANVWFSGGRVRKNDIVVE